MRTPEIPIVEKDTTEHGFNESNIARKREGRGFDNSQVQKSAPAGKQRKPLTRLRQKIKRLARRRDSLSNPSKESEDLVK